MICAPILAEKDKITIDTQNLRTTAVHVVEEVTEPLKCSKRNPNHNGNNKGNIVASKLNDTTFKTTLLDDTCIKIGWKRQNYTRHCYGMLSFLIFELKIEFFQKAVDRFFKNSGFK